MTGAVVSGEAVMGEAVSLASDWDVVIVGGGPAGLSAALNLARARRRVLVLDSNRPRNSATFRSHGFLSRDGVSPLELRRLGREELDVYPNASFQRSQVTRIELVETPGSRTFSIDNEFSAATVVIATGLREQQPTLPSLRQFYGTSIHSCMECDGYEYSDQPIALIGESSDLAERAMLLSQWSRDLIVFTNGIGEVSEAQEQRLGGLGIRVERRVILDVTGNRDGVTGVVLADGETIPRVGIFVRPLYTPMLDYVAPLGVVRDANDLIVVDAVGRTSVDWVYAIGDCTPPGPQQLIVAAGQGAITAAAINQDLL